MVTYLFWNLGRKPLQTTVARLAERHDVDVLMLVECSEHPAAILLQLNQRRTQYHFAVSPGCERVRIFTRFPSDFIRPVYEEDRLTIRRLELPGQTTALLAVVHFISKLRYSEGDQEREAAILSATIRKVEQEIGHDRTLLVGDFNMNPFENGLITADGLHATMSRQIAAREKRTVQSREYPFFYNPMWNYLGDETPGPPGTFYYNDTGHRALFWNMFDQVMLRPSLLSAFEGKYLSILETDGEVSLLSGTGQPNRETGSDHLPILFRLQL